MAQNLQQLRRRIKTASNIAQIAKAMEMISASKIKKAQKAVESNKPYFQRISDLTGKILRYVNTSEFKHMYTSTNESPNKLIFVISPDKGLCGSLNTNLFKALLEKDGKNVKYITMGKKASQFVSRLEGESIASFNMGTVLPDYKIVFQLIEIINREYGAGNVSSVEILYNEFNSLFAQAPAVKKILPIELAPSEEELPYVFEPKAEEILQDLLPHYLEVMLYSTLIEGCTSEQAARMVAMQNAKNNALDIADYLTLSYNKTRQEKITNELLALGNNI